MNEIPENVPQTVAVQEVPVNRFLKHDGTDAGAAFRAGLEITSLCVVGIAFILTLYYVGLRLLVVMFPPKPVTESTANDD